MSDPQIDEFRKDLEQFEELMSRINEGKMYRVSDIRQAQQQVYVSREGFYGAFKDYEREYNNIKTNYQQIQQVQNNLINSYESYRNAYSTLLTSQNNLAQQCNAKPVKRMIAESPDSSPRSDLSDLATAAQNVPRLVTDPVWDLIQRINPKSLEIRSEPALITRFNSLVNRRLKEIQRPMPGDEDL